MATKNKSRGNFVCTLIGWRDRLFRQIILDDGGKAWSGFIKSRHALHHEKISKALNRVICAQSEARIKANKIIARLTAEDVKLIKKGSSNIQEARKLKSLSPKFDEIVVFAETLKAMKIKLHTELEAIDDDIQSQITGYLLGGVSRKKHVDIEINSKISYKETEIYRNYIESYENEDKYIEEIVDKIKSNGTSIDRKEEEAA